MECTKGGEEEISNVYLGIPFRVLRHGSVYTPPPFFDPASYNFSRVEDLVQL
jgi:hypothetical protein